MLKGHLEWWPMTVISALQKLKQKDQELKDNLGCTESLTLLLATQRDPSSKTTKTHWKEMISTWSQKNGSQYECMWKVMLRSILLQGCKVVHVWVCEMCFGVYVCLRCVWVCACDCVCVICCVWYVCVYVCLCVIWLGMVCDYVCVQKSEESIRCLL